MKKIMIIGVLSLALITSLLLLNRTSAAATAGSTTLQINGGSNSCSYGTSLNFGAMSISTLSYNRTGNFTGASTNTFSCSDNAGTLNAWAMTLQATTNLTGTYGQTIPKTGVFLKTATRTMTGSCVASAWTTSWTAINGTQTIVGKTSATWNLCTLTVTGVQLYVTIPASQSVGIYTWTLSLDVPF